ncbi:MAG: hypothetical protein LBT74_07625, partial [Acidobacteriota bacterium]|nr:hypothetical protein [Acidobacteriota bacterium]
MRKSARRQRPCLLTLVARPRLRAFVAASLFVSAPASAQTAQTTINATENYVHTYTDPSTQSPIHITSTGHVQGGNDDVINLKGGGPWHVTNEGYVGGGYPIQVESGALTLDNSGSVVSNHFGVVNWEATGVTTINNSGTISASTDMTGRTADGIQLYMGSNATALINNSGTISGDNSGDRGGFGMVIFGAADNSSSVSVTNTSAGVITGSHASNNGAQGLTIIGGKATVDNAGRIEVTRSNASGAALIFDKVIEGTITNTGTIIGAKTSGDGRGISFSTAAGATGPVSITNKSGGSITTGVGAGDALLLDTSLGAL